jgi:hypothetical protein
MTPFIEKFREVGARETRSIMVNKHEDLPDGEYDFVELYCNEPGCDCRRVIIDVLRPETGFKKVWATIGYGWESLDFYRKRGWPADDPDEMKGPYLDMLNPQSEHSDTLLTIFRVILESPDYVERLKRHYRMFKDAVDMETGRIENRRKRLRNPRRRRKHPR